jgi:hypothetical protein
LWAKEKSPKVRRIKGRKHRVLVAWLGPAHLIAATVNGVHEVHNRIHKNRALSRWAASNCDRLCGKEVFVFMHEWTLHGDCSVCRRPELAISYLRTASSLRPDWPEAQQNLAILLRCEQQQKSGGHASVGVVV